MPPTSFLGALRRWWLPDFRATLAEYLADVQSAWLLFVARPSWPNLRTIIRNCGGLLVVLSPWFVVQHVLSPLWLRWTIHRPALLAWWSARPTLASSVAELTEILRAVPDEAEYREWCETRQTVAAMPTPLVPPLTPAELTALRRLN